MELSEGTNNVKRKRLGKKNRGNNQICRIRSARKLNEGRAIAEAVFF
jgi:hypothetical protein